MAEKDIGYVAGKVDAMHNTLSNIEKAIIAQNDRVRNLEIWRGYILGISVAVALAVSIAVKVLL